MVGSARLSHVSALPASFVAFCTDFMINIHMLVWGAKHIGPVSDLRMDADPATTWMNMALAHARQVRCNTTRAGARQQAHWDQQWQLDNQMDRTCV